VRLKRAISGVLSGAESVTLSVEPSGDVVKIVVHGEFRGGLSEASVFVARAVVERHGGELRSEPDVEMTLPVSA
jgi:hypothetical protein